MKLHTKAVHAGDRKKLGDYIPVTTPIYGATSFMEGFAVASTLTSRTRPLCRFVFLQSKYSFPAFLRLSPRGLRPATSALRFPTVTSIGPGRIVSSC